MLARTIQLSKDRKLVFDHDGERYRVAFYQPAMMRCKGCPGNCTRQQQNNCRFVLRKEMHSMESRTTGTDVKLDWAIAKARGESAPSLDTALITDYIASTEWGRKLPGLNGWKAIDPALLQQESA